ncbi:MAG: GNAT family protein [Chloroflexota bacterium]
MLPNITLRPVAREDVQRLAGWLSDEEVNSLWYGVGEGGFPLHVGYSPRQILDAPESEWRLVFENPDRKVYAIYTNEGEHIGEGQLAVQWELQEAQLFVLVGRKDLWHHHYGTMALVSLLDEAYETHRLHRVWVDIPDYNEHALQMCRHLGFVLEGHLRKTHKKNDDWYDSFAMGLLADEYFRRRSRLLGASAR